MDVERRRTQQERREYTVSKILDATMASLGEVGYTATTIREVCTRADVSSGGLFRHFPTRVDLMAAAADRVREQQIANFRGGLELLQSDSVRDCLLLLRAACRAPVNAAWYELLGASRADTELRAHLAPVTERYHKEIADVARQLPVMQDIPEDQLDMVLFTVVHLLDGEALSAVVHAQPEQEGPRLEMIARILTGGTLLG
ncbi:TetR/AcrR family transcriptional regulator [Rhodococcus sp. IEGM 1379]|uniref:TetR/AcrR family transcriptional regulator n=1 Tax=Rhodococcus sp. IEGM 1379 TaxID=3047086 RepID=UPI0024B76161|nr:TetR/AcrR family transcriptional regulator [Rhodococcus sp. IEGM 1379]